VVREMATLKPEAPAVVDTTSSASSFIDAAKKRQKARSFAIAMGLVFLIVLFYLITIFKLGGHLIKGAA
jgi:hypothetical protein